MEMHFATVLAVGHGGWGCGAGLGGPAPRRAAGQPQPLGKAACIVLPQEKPYQRRWSLKAASCQTHDEMIINVGDFIKFFFKL